MNDPRKPIAELLAKLTYKEMRDVAESITDTIRATGDFDKEDINDMAALLADWAAGVLGSNS